MIRFVKTALERWAIGYLRRRGWIVLSGNPAPGPCVGDACLLLVLRETEAARWKVWGRGGGA